jgi:CheY-like chemotaxis protein
VKKPCKAFEVLFVEIEITMKFYRNTCLLVNSDRRDQEIFESVLTYYLPETLYCIASNGKEALSMILEDEIIPDVIFIESELPVMGSIEFLKRLKKEPTCRNIPVIVRVNSRGSKKIKAIQSAGATGIYTGKYCYESVHNMMFIHQFEELILMHSN